MSFSQNSSNKDQQLSEAFQTYTKLPREISYAHLNKTTLIKGEDLGFTVYLLDKNTKKPSRFSTNVYCILENRNGQVIKSTMLLASDGVAFSAFEIDSTFSSGNYTFKAYTNWMKNFDEQNFHVQNIKIIDPEEKNDMTPKLMSPYFDAQFLPEGGHLVANIQNTVGVIIKDSLGYGIPDISGSVVDANTKILAEFKTNEFGIGKFIITPKDNESYRVNLGLQAFKKELDFPKAEVSGLNMSITDLNGKIALTVKSNEITSQKIQGRDFKLTIHNGVQIKALDIVFTDSKEFSTIIGYSTLYPGINIFTLFDDTNKPILERLFFNYEGIPIITSSEVIKSKSNDTLSISIPYKNINANLSNNFSVSVLPEGTIASNNHQGIISSTYLQPYVKGVIENAIYYFTDVSKEKKYNLDLLLLTQGWSSYDWTDIFNYAPTTKFKFESGIDVTASINNSKSKQFLIYPLANSPSFTVDVPENENQFILKGLFPINNETVNISGFNNRGASEKPNLYVQFSPSKILNIQNFTKLLPLKEKTIFNLSEDQILFDRYDEKIEELDEVVVNAQKKQNRFEKLRRRHNGSIDLFDEITRGSNMDFAAYISSKGYLVVTHDTLGKPDFRVKTQKRNTFMKTGGDVLIYFDDVLLSDISILNNYNMRLVDYVVINKTGFGEGMRGSNGVIKIYTDPAALTFEGSKVIDLGQQIKVPLTFSTPKKFYVPIYSTHRNDFFEKFGVIDWLPNEKVDSQGNLNLRIPDKYQNLKLFIEGFTEDGSYVSEIKTVTAN